MSTITLSPADLMDLLEAAFQRDDERALRLVEEAGLSRFELSMLRRDFTPAETEDAYVDYNLLASASAEGHVAGYRRAVENLRDHDRAEAADFLEMFPETVAS